jgi:hypothetical protein
MFVFTNGKLEESWEVRVSRLNFTIVLQYADNVELRIPVEADAIHPEKADLPKGYSLRLEN